MSDDFGVEDEAFDDHRVVEIAAELSNERIDKALAASLPELSRARIQALIADGRVLIGDTPVADGSAKAKAGTVVQIFLPPPVAAEPAAENIPLKVLYEDEALIVIDKPAGLTVHPARVDQPSRVGSQQ